LANGPTLDTAECHPNSSAHACWQTVRGSEGSAVTEETSQASLPRPSRLYQVATLPILLLGFRRRRVRDSVLADLITFAGPIGQAAFAVLAAVAVAYPIVASFVHASVEAFTTIRNGNDLFALAMFPLFDFVYAESLPFMAAAAVLGLFSPALGALFVAVFVPADLIATNASRELASMPWQIPFGALISRLISYVMLWLLAVEIPLRVRAVGDIVGGWDDGTGSTGRVVLGRVLAAAALVYVWTRSLPWVIAPVYTWSNIQIVQSSGIRPIWWNGQVLVIAAIAAAAVSAVWPGLPAGRPAEGYGSDRDERPRSMTETVLRQTGAALVLALLSAGLLTTVAEAAILVVGLLVMGPVVTVVGPRVPLPAALTGLPDPVRWAVAIAAGVGVAFVLLLLGGDGLYTDSYTGLMLVLALSGIVVRLLLVGGTPAAGPVVQRQPPDLPAPVVSVLSLVAFALLWLALPAIALGDDCSDLSAGELTSCAKALFYASLLPPIIGFLVGAAILNRAMEGKGHPPPKKTPPPPTYTGGRYVPGAGKQPGQYGPKPPPKSEPPPGFWDSLTKW
jgi:hypothetical protein